MTYNKKQKQNIYIWNKKHVEKHLAQNRTNFKAYYERNKEKLRVIKLAKNRLGIEFYNFCKIYSNLCEENLDL